MKKYVIIILALILGFILLILFSLPSAIVARYDKLKLENPLLASSTLDISFFTSFPNLSFSISDIKSPDNYLTAKKATFQASIFKLLSSNKLSLTVFLDGAFIDIENFSAKSIFKNGTSSSENVAKGDEVNRFIIGKVELRDSEIIYKGNNIKSVLGTLKLNFDKSKDSKASYYDLILHGVMPSADAVQMVARFNLDKASRLIGIDEALFVLRNELQLRVNSAISFADEIRVTSPIVANLKADNASIKSLGGLIKPLLPSFKYFDNASSGLLTIDAKATFDKKLTDFEARFDIKDIVSRSKYLNIDNGSASFDGKLLKLDNISFELYGAKGKLNGEISGVKQAVLKGEPLHGNVNVVGDSLNFDKFMEDSIAQNEENLKESKRESTHSVKIIYFDHFEKSDINLKAKFNKVNYLGSILNEVEFNGFIWNGAIHLDDFSSKKVSAEIGF